MKKNTAFKFRIYPNKEQEVLLSKTFGCCRFIYNKLLEDKKTYYEICGEMLYNTPAQYKEKNEFLKEVDSLALSNVQLNLEEAFKKFFREPKVGLPKFKAKNRCKNSYTTNLVNNNIKLLEDIIVLPKLKGIKIKIHRRVPEGYRIKSVTVSRAKTNEYYASILFEYEKEIEEVEIKKVIGLDYSMKDLYVTSEGEVAEYPKYYCLSKVKLAIEQRRLSKCKKGSKNYEKQRLKVAKLHEHIKNQRRDFMHKRSNQIANEFDAVCIEDLNMKGLQQALNFGKTVSDNAWGTFVRYLEYKLKDRGKKLIVVDKWYPSSKTCSSCGKVKETLELSERIYICECGYIEDRDINAAINIKTEGMKQLA